MSPIRMDCGDPSDTGMFNSDSRLQLSSPIRAREHAIHYELIISEQQPLKCVIYIRHCADMETQGENAEMRKMKAGNGK